MLTRFARNQLIAFVVVASLTVGFSLFAYVDAPKLLGIGYYDVQVELTDGGDIYPQSVVTVRGVPIGQVTEVRPTRDGVLADLRLRTSEPIPASAPVQVRSVSAAGEQYLNFEPNRTDGPLLNEGDVVPASQVTVPVDNAQLLGNVNELLASVPGDRLEVTVDELGEAFAGTSEDLKRLLDSILPLQQKFDQNLDPTRQLIDQLEPVLATQRDTDPQIRAFAGNLARFTGQLARSDAQLRATIDQVPGVADESRELLTQLDRPLGMLLANLTSVGEVVRVYNPAVAHTLTLLPATASGLQSAVNSSPLPGAVSLHLQAVVNDPPACTEGFVQDRRDPSDISPAEPPTTVGCAVPEDSNQAVRGARNYPCPDDPARRATSAAGCGLQFQDPAEVAEVQQEAIDTQMRSAEDNPTTAAEDGDKPAGTPNTGADRPGADLLSYDAGTGLVFPDDSGPFMVGRTLGPAADWQQMLTGPLGLPTSP